MERRSSNRLRFGTKNLSLHRQALEYQITDLHAQVTGDDGALGLEEKEDVTLSR
jgi:hypothetical protein